MPKDVTVKVYRFEELSDEAKDRARDWWRDVMEFAWSDESLDSIRAFCDKFGIRLRNWNIGPFCHINYELSEYDNSYFRGMKLRDFERECYPTGYCLDATLSIEFYDTFKKTGDAKLAFESAVYAGFMAWRGDMEYQTEPEYIDDCLIANEYEFTEDGSIW